jgi:hypothetical protein
MEVRGLGSQGCEGGRKTQVFQQAVAPCSLSTQLLGCKAQSPEVTGWGRRDGNTRLPPITII